jgi:site-specific recombinase XerD
LRQFKIQQQELSYLTLEQIDQLLTALRLSRNPHAELVSRICLATGARWSEAEELRETQVHDGLIEYARTKSGKTRAVPIDGCAASYLCQPFHVQWRERHHLILEHANITITMRYTHLSPDYLQEAKSLNPLTRLTLR